MAHLLQGVHGAIRYLCWYRTSPGFERMVFSCMITVFISITFDRTLVLVCSATVLERTAHFILSALPKDALKRTGSSKRFVVVNYCSGSVISVARYVARVVRCSPRGRQPHHSHPWIRSADHSQMSAAHTARPAGRRSTSASLQEGRSGGA